jgi:hypothetical protein
VYGEEVYFHVDMVYALPVWEDKYCGRWSVLFQSMSASDGMFHSPSHASVVVFGVCNVGPLPSKGSITIAKGEDHIFRVEGEGMGA